MDPLSMAASIAGLVTLAGATLSMTRTSILEAKNGQETAQEFLQELNVLQFNLARLDAFLRSEGEAVGFFDDTSVLVSSTRSCRIKLTALHDKLVEGSKERRLSLHTFGWPLKVKEHRQMIVDLRAFVHWIQFALTINGCTLLAKTSTDVLDVLRKQVESFQLLQKVDDRTHSIERSQWEQSQALERSRASEERNKILDWISTLKHQQKHHDICRPRVRGTGDWLLHEANFATWVKYSQRDNVLWCQGIQGSGKTILASIVVDYIKDRCPNRNVGIAYFYFNYQDGRKQTAELVLASLLRQITESRPDIPKPISELFKRIESQHRQLQQQDLEQAILISCADLERTFIVIDALDECDNEYRKDLLRSLSALQKIPSVTIFLTSRPHVGQEVIRKLGNPLQIEIGATDTDLRTYLSSKIDDSDNVDVIDEDFKEEIIVKVIQAAHRMFLLAALQIRSVLNKTSAGDMDEALEHLPRDLDDAFAKTLQRIQSQPDGQDTLGMATIMWIAHARRPLHVTELSEALAIKPGSTSLKPRFRPSQKRMVDCCMGLVTVDEKSSVIRLVHFSVQEYLHQYQEGLFAQSETTIAEACITYLLFEPFAGGPRRKEAEIVEMISKNAFVRYAAHNWGSHVRSAGNNIVDKLALTFLQAEAQRGCSLQILHYSAHLREEYWNDEESRSCNGLHLAAMFGLEELGRQLLNAKKIRVDDATKMGTTALIKAAAGGHKQFTGMLLRMHADRTKENWYGTALHCAAEAGQVTTILTLLETGLGVNIRDRRGRTSLHCATVSGHPSAIQSLLEHGAAVNTTCNKNYTPLRYAVVWEQPLEIVRMLLEHGADTESRSSHDVTPLHDSAVMNAVDTVLLLLEYNADVDAEDEYGGTPLHFAAERNYATMVQLLIDHEARINAKTHEGVTALYLAAGNGGQETVEVLLRNGADTEVGDDEGITPIDVAIREYHQTVVQSLIAAGARMHQGSNFAAQFEIPREKDATEVGLQPLPVNQASEHQDLCKEEAESKNTKSQIMASEHLQHAEIGARASKTSTTRSLHRPSRLANGYKTHAISSRSRIFQLLREEPERVMELKTQEKQPCSKLRDDDQRYHDMEFPGGVKDGEIKENKAHRRDDLRAFHANRSTFACQSPECHFKSTVEDVYKQHMERVHGWTHINANPLDDLYSPETTTSSHSLTQVDDNEELGSIAHLLGDMKIDNKYHGHSSRARQHPPWLRDTQECENSHSSPRQVPNSVPAVVVGSSYNYSRPAMQTVRDLKRDYLQGLHDMKDITKADGFKIEALKWLEREELRRSLDSDSVV